MRKLKLSEMVLDFDLYPRGSVDSHHAADMQKAIAAGATLPPIIVCKKTKRIADGVHRHRCYSKLYGEDYETEVVEKQYKNDKEFFLDAMRFNANHGLRLDTHDKAHCILVANRLGIDDKLIADAIHADVKWIGSLKTDRTARSGSLVVPIKRTIQHKAGQQLTDTQVQANDKLSGMNQVFYVNQVITLIESELIDRDDDDLFLRLKHLHELLDELLTVAQ